MHDVPNGFTGFSGQVIHEPKEPVKMPEQPEYTPFDEAEILKMRDIDRRWSWVEIDLSAIRHNVMQAKSLLAPGTRLLAVVKADAYGHGAVQVAKTALSAGAEYLGVATVDEAIELRQADIKAPIMILSEPPLGSIPLLLHFNIEPAVYTVEFAIAYAEIADHHGMKAPYHLAVNTGMNRIGVRYDEVMEFMMAVSFHRALELKGTFTHFATADSPESYDFHAQMRRFIEALTAMHDAGIDAGLVHCDNSAALLRYPETNFDMVRWGIGMYGYYPCPEVRDRIKLKPAMSVHARITDAKTVPVSEGVSYGLHYRSPGSVKICTIPIGYADGLSRILSGNMKVILNGEMYPQVGNICMDQCMFEIDLRIGGNKPRPNPQIGDEVIIVGSDNKNVITMDDLADAAGTISYEMMCGFKMRMPRIYV